MEKKSAAKKTSKAFKIIGGTVLALLVLFLVIREIGRGINGRTLEGGINESMYIDVNGTEQWINIYGEDIRNPVLLYLHGGPGSATSDIDYVFTRKWADVYTVVTWDQRNCGKSYDAEQNDIVLTRDLLLEDGKEVTEFLLDYLSKEKITILGHSWGSIYGANLVLEYPEYYECFIGTGQLVDYLENEKAFKQEALRWAEGDEETLAQISQLTPEHITLEYVETKDAIMEKYGYGMMANGRDYNEAAVLIFNPNYSVVDWIKYFNRDPSVYLAFDMSEEFTSFSLKGRFDYPMPYYNINGDKDYQTNYKLAQDYFDKVNAPYKQLYLMENMTHGLLESDSEGFSDILHQIAETQSVRTQLL